MYLYFYGCGMRAKNLYNVYTYTYTQSPDWKTCRDTTPSPCSADSIRVL